MGGSTTATAAAEVVLPPLPSFVADWSQGRSISVSVSKYGLGSVLVIFFVFVIGHTSLRSGARAGVDETGLETLLTRAVGQRGGAVI